MSQHATHRFVCSHDGCGKSFVRKEHLNRHFRGSHNSEDTHICKVCSKSFNRSDSLLRHLSRHGHAKTPSGRSKRACILCHTSKIKCDGNRQCQGCTKKGVKCRYTLQDDDGNSLSGPSEGLELEIQESTGIPTCKDHDALMSGLESNRAGLQSIFQTHESSTNPRHEDSTIFSASPSLRSIGLPTPRSEGMIDWTTIRIEPDSHNPQNRASNVSYDTPNAVEYLETYFAHFHHRWPMLHRVGYDDHRKGRVHDALIPSMVMVGGWLYGDSVGKQYALSAHKNILPKCLSSLSQITSRDNFQQSLQAGLVQASLLNIIFVLYCGTEEIVSRGIMLRSVLVAALREVGFFKHGVTWPDDRPGYFLPMHMMKLGERQRIAASLFKIDAYLNLIRGNPPGLAVEELVFQLPNSLSLWCANGLHAVEERLKTLPLQRSKNSIAQMIIENILGPVSPKQEEPLFWEDLQLCFLALQPKIYNLHAIARSSSEPSVSIESQRSSIRRVLDSLKFKYDSMASQPLMPPSTLQSQNNLFQQYYGFEDHTEPGWELEVAARISTLKFDNLMLYHTLNLHLYFSMSRAIDVARTYFQPVGMSASETQNSDLKDKRCNIAFVLASIDGRRALCHSVDILTAFRTQYPSSSTERERGDPIAYVALSTAALIIWTHLSYGVLTCDKCVAGDEIRVEEKEGDGLNREEWIQKGITHEVKISGYRICPCNLGCLMSEIKSYIPVGWELMNELAPVVFT